MVCSVGTCEDLRGLVTPLAVYNGDESSMVERDKQFVLGYAGRVHAGGGEYEVQV